ncbi:M1 family metallopeptidase [Flavobacterium sp.]|uniref:M1 family metallopeptidase n=1 Tax=Flavobacterium sp. TaxID=239 RepID=UPI00260CB967|nr:M1 family metallopeptidase [Flavobacterium sp.]
MKYLILLFFSFLSFSQQISKVDFIKCDANVQPNFKTKSVYGEITYEFKVLSEIDSIRIDAKNIDFKEVLINGKSVNYKNNKKELILFEGFKKGKNKVSFTYNAIPKQTIYFTGIDKGQQIWTQGQGKFTSHWLPSFDDVNEKVIFNISVTIVEEMNAMSKFTAISNGVLTETKVARSWSEGDNYLSYKFKMQRPMSSYLVMIAIGNFLHKTESSNSGIPLENYYKPMDEDKYQYTYKDSKTIFDFLEKEIGVKYPWKIYRQVPVEDFLYAGMENTSATIFSQDYVVDESGFNDRNYLNVNAHELAHQWFGDLVTAKSGKHHWLQEGFATYYALLAERKVFGDDYFYNQLYSYANRLKVAAKTDTIPVMNEKASSLSFYQKGAWALHYIKESIGEKKFRKAVKNYLKRYQFKNAETDDFLAEIKKVSDFDTENFKKVWLEDYKYPANDINFLLTKNAYIKDLLKLQQERKTILKDKYYLFKTILESNGYFPLKIEVIYQIRNEPFEKVSELYDLAMKSNDVAIRKAVAETLSKVPVSFKSDYETLLNDTSYETKQTSFITLWKNFPEQQSKYLEIAKDWQGRSDKELRILYLTSCILYADTHENDQKASIIALKAIDELKNYTSPSYESSIRQNAFDSYLSIYPENDEVLKNLVNATTHHKWQFTKYARDKIRELIKNEKSYLQFEKLLPDLSIEEKNQLQRLLIK